MKKVIFQVFVSLIFLSCKEEITVVPESKTDLLTKQKWNIYKYTIGTLNTPTRSISQLASEKNNGKYYADFSFAYSIYKKDGNLTVLNTSNELVDYKWKFINETQIETTRVQNGNSQIDDIIELSETRLVLKTTLKKGVTSNDRWNLTAADLRSHGFGVGFTEVYIIEEFEAQR